MKGQQSYKAGIYCRISRDDETKSESASISTQKAMITKYAHENGWEIFDYYVDDGVSGLTFQRPEFIRMINDIDRKRINMVITKDLSRLGRDYILTGHYVEVYFPSKDVRYIAINDVIDTIHDNNDMTPFKAVINEMYAKDISKKVRSALKIKAQMGYFLGTYAPYGYRIDPENCHKLIVDEEAAAVVRRVFSMYLQGAAIGGIVRALNDDGVDTPMQHARKLKPEMFKAKKWYGDKLWLRCSVKNILKNTACLGNMVNCRQRTRSFKCKELIRNDESDWIIVEGAHEAIISKEDFDETQRMMETRRKPMATGTPHIFSGLLRCEDCNKVIVLNRNVKQAYFCCSSYKQGGRKYCSSHNIRFDVLINYIFEDIKYNASLAKVNKAAILSKLLSENNSVRKSRLNKLKNEVKRISVRENEISKVYKQLYEDKVNGVIKENHFFSFRKQYDIETETLKSRKIELQDALANAEISEKEASRFMTMIEKYTDIHELDSAIVHELIDRIYIGERVVEGKNVKQEIRIVYKFIGEMA